MPEANTQKEGNLVLRCQQASERWYRAFSESRPMCFVGTLLVTAVLFTLLNASWVQTTMNDDWSISAVLAPMDGDALSTCLFISPFLSWPISFLNKTLPFFNWFFVVELTCAYITYFLVCYLAFRRAHPFVACTMFTFITVVMLPQISLFSNFTVVAGMCAVAGGATLLLETQRDRVRPLPTLLGILLLALSAAWRWRATLMCLPVFFVALIATAVLGAWKGRGARFIVAKLLPIALSLVAAACVAIASQWILANGETASWQANRNVASELDDYPLRPYSEVADELEALGVSENDYTMVQRWISEDPDFYTTERLEGIVEVASLKPSFVQSLPRATVEYANSMLHDYLRLGTLVAIVVSLLIVCGRRGRLWILAVLAIPLLEAIAFQAIGRLPTRVHDTIWFAGYASAFCTCVIAQAQTNTRQTTEAREDTSPLIPVAGLVFQALPAFCIAAVLVVVGTHFAPGKLAAVLAAESFKPQCSLLSYIDDHPDNVVVVSVTSNVDVKTACYLRAIPPENYRNRVVLLGGWSARSPYNMAKNARLGMQNPIRGLVENSQALLVIQKDGGIDQILTFLQEHYYPNARAEKVDVIQDSDRYGTLDVYRFYNE